MIAAFGALPRRRLDGLTDSCEEMRRFALGLAHQRLQIGIAPNRGWSHCRTPTARLHFDDKISLLWFHRYPMVKSGRYEQDASKSLEHLLELRVLQRQFFRQLPPQLSDVLVQCGNLIGKGDRRHTGVGVWSSILYPGSHGNFWSARLPGSCLPSGPIYPFGGTRQLGRNVGADFVAASLDNNAPRSFDAKIVFDIDRRRLYGRCGLVRRWSDERGIRRHRRRDRFFGLGVRHPLCLLDSSSSRRQIKQELPW
ncbi:hypothetical protein [Ensifer sp. 4252]|uniref:hypothetical protein n=1 Tax=Ensifer sp. 4252 TaxID=3373915 RepID=UPI003D1A5B34